MYAIYFKTFMTLSWWKLLIDTMKTRKDEFEKDLIKYKLLKLFQSYIRTHNITYHNKQNISSFENTLDSNSEKYSIF